MTENQTNTEAAKTPPSQSIKGFDGNLKCRGFTFEVGKAYAVEGAIKACKNGFHAIPADTHPLSVFNYYPPVGGRYALVSQAGECDKDGDKLASAKITIDVEISLDDLIKRAIDWVFSRAKWAGGPIAVEDNEAATASGYRGAATASGDQGAATASGTQGAATASGYRGAATASGDRGAATASGDRGAATASGDQGAAIVTGWLGAVKGSIGCDLFAREFNDSGKRISIACGTVGEDGIAPDVWYVCKNGKLIPKD